MIFRTINADAKKLTEQFGLLNKSFRDIKKDFANGLGFKNSLFQTSISKTDYQALQKFNSAIKVTNDGLTKSQRITKAWNENMSGCSIAAKRMGNDLVTGKKNIQDISKAMNTASVSTKALGVAMNVMANVGFMLAITAITKVISELAQAQDNAAQAAKEATETYKSELDSIADYKQRLSELHEELKSGNLSYEETKTKRTELMTIQDELIEKFGTEKSAIESVTDAVNGQVDALDDLNEKAYRDWVAKADDQTFWNNLLPGGKSGLDQAIDYMETEKTVSFMDMQNANLSDELQAIQKEIDETIRAKYNLDKTFAMFNVIGTPDELRTQLENIRQDYADFSKEVFDRESIPDKMWEEYRKETIDSINEAILGLDKGLEKHQDTYRTYIEGLIKYDSEYSDEYANILQKRAELESAQNSGNEEEVKRAKQEFMDSINDAIIASDSDESIKKYFESLYPELQAEFDNWAFEFDLKTNVKWLEDTAKEIGEKYTATDLLGMIDDESAVIADSAFNSLIDKAIEYGVCTDKSAEEVQKLIDLLVELGIVQENFNDKSTISLSDITSQISSLTSAQEALNTAISEQNKNGTISNETLKKLSENYDDIDSVLETTTNGIRINTQAFAKLNAERKNAIQSELSQKEEELTEIYNNGSIQLAMYEETLANCTDTKSEDYKILSDLIEKKKADQEATLCQIGELENLSLEYENAISKHNAFIKALSSEDAGNGYDAVTSGLKQVEEEWSKGNYGKDEIRTFVDYMSYADMSTASISEIKNAYDEAMKSAKKYFTETVDGQQNFLNLLKDTKVNQEALASVDENGNWTINISDMDEAAKACGFSVDFLSDNLKKLEEKGFEGAFSDKNGLIDTSAQLKELDKQIAILETRLNSGDSTNGLQEQLNKLKDTRTKISVELDQSKVKKAIDDILAIQEQINNLSNTGAPSSEISSLKQQQQSIADKNGIDLNSVLKVDTNDAESKWKVFEETVEKADLKTKVTVNANTNPFDTAIRTITNGKYTADIGLKITTSGIVSKVKEVFKNAVSKATGDAGAYGSANITGSSYADGNIGVKKEQKNVMVSEISPEMVVDPHSGEYTIYKTPTMLAKLPKDAIVFNGKQTEEILKNGMTTSFGKAYAKGYNSSGTLTGGSSNSSTPKSKSSSSSKDKNNKKSSKTEIDWIARKLEQLQKKIDLTKAKFDNLFSLKTKSSNLDDQIKQTTKLMNAESKAADKYKKKAENYAKSSGLSKSLQKAVQEGRLEKYSLKDLIKKYGEKTANKIQEYQKWYDNYQATQKQAIELETEILNLREQQYQLYVDDADANIDKLNAEKDIAIGYKDQNKYLEDQKAHLKQSYDYQIKIAELTEDEVKKAQLQAEYEQALRDLENDKFENIKTYYDNEVKLLDNQFTSLDNKISEIETAGKNVNKSYYESQKKLNDDIKKSYEEEKIQLESQLANIKQGTDEWYDAKDAIQECDNKISDCVKSTYELNNAINELHFNMFDDIADSIDRIITEQEFLQGLFAHEKSTDDKTGSFTDAGLAKLGSLSASYYSAKEKAKRDADEVKELQRMIDSGSLHSDILGITFNSAGDLEKKLKEMYTQWQDDIKEIYSLESDIADMMKEKYQSELDLLQELIDRKKEALEKEKDLHDYQLSIQKKTKDINTIRSQISAYSGDTSQEASAKLQKLQNELSEKENDLHETEYDRYISDQEEMLSRLYEEYEELMTKKLEDFMALVKEGLENAENNTSTISSYLSDISENNGYVEQYKELFTLVSGSIEQSANKIIENMAADVKSVSGTEDISASKNNQTDSNNSNSGVDINGKHYGTGLKKIEAKTRPLEIPFINKTPGIISREGTVKADSESALSVVKSYVKKHAIKAEKKKSEYSDINKAIYDNKAKAYDGTGKVLSGEDLKGLAKELGIKYDNGKKTGNLYTALKKIKFPGFKKGGIAKLIKSQGEDGITLARNGEGFIAPEHVKPIEELVESVPQVNNVIKTLDGVELVPVQPGLFKNIPTDIAADMIKNTTPDLSNIVNLKLPDIQPASNLNNDINIDLGGVTMYGVNDPKEFTKQLVHSIQSEGKVQKAIRASSTDLLIGGSRLGVNKIRC